jgi:hypothetical protein
MYPPDEATHLITRQSGNLEGFHTFVLHQFARLIKEFGAELDNAKSAAIAATQKVSFDLETRRLSSPAAL